MPDYAMFSLDDDAGRAETVTAPDPEAAAALVQTKYPGATTSAIPAEELEGCNRSKLLWEWMSTGGSWGGLPNGLCTVDKPTPKTLTTTQRTVYKP